MTPPPDPAPSARPFRELMARWATGVAIVTAHDASGDAGLTVNALLSVSLTPPSLLISLSQDADTTPVIHRSGSFAVNFLAADQRALSERFALPSPPSEKFKDLAFHRERTGAALLDGTLGAAECKVVAWTPRYDHVLILGEVVHQEVGRDSPPLLFFRSGYSSTDGAGVLHLAPPKAPE
ncbi:MAG: flavin reductase family protein [Thermoplasmata archaeon]|jgi:3-hydroxy-9,10-secoandrosta-1,3,5(10)-triene-9,17-dione monooxygenase reductase component|nr:flavin reductase family protein [Thermoplasmata archaeon]